ncbi:MAG: ABC transporter ATP-binding protein [Chloroflexi bacterium]|nr:ABC transporter ATP-binding protein [Chloroflexota bacterium]
MKLELRSISKTFHTRRGNTYALQEITAEVASGEFVCLLGPSGCGKSTLLNIVAGLERPDAGVVLIDDQPVTGPGRDRVMIFQEAALFPWLNVRDNVTFGLNVAGLPRSEQLAIADRYLERVGLRGFEKAYVYEISGGMKQRVALARALALDPLVLLMDEPFAALDAQTRDLLHTELQDIWLHSGKTIIFVTHNVREALVLGDRVLLMSARPGRIKREFCCQLARPRQIEDHALVDVAREVLADLREEVMAAKQEVGSERLAA